jgi:hypothetical protein
VLLEFPYFLIGRKSSEQLRNVGCQKTFFCFMIATIRLQYHSSRKMTSEQNEKVFHRADLQLKLPGLALCGGNTSPCDNSENI